MSALVALARAIPMCPGAPAKQRALLDEFRRASGLALEAWQFEGAVFYPAETRTFVECVLSHLETPVAPSLSDAEAWIDQLRERREPIADVHHTLRALEALGRAPGDLARLVFFTAIPARDVLSALVDGRCIEALVTTGEPVLDIREPDSSELEAMIAVAGEAIDCADSGDREGLRRAARVLSKMAGQRISESELRALPGAMSVEEWAGGMLLSRELMQRDRIDWSMCLHAVGRYVDSIRAMRDGETFAISALLDAATPYPHVRIDFEMPGETPDMRRETAQTITEHVAPWGAPRPT